MSVIPVFPDELDYIGNDMCSKHRYFIWDDCFFFSLVLTEMIISMYA